MAFFLLPGCCSRAHPSCIAGILHSSLLAKSLLCRPVCDNRTFNERSPKPHDFARRRPQHLARFSHCPRPHGRVLVNYLRRGLGRVPTPRLRQPSIHAAASPAPRLCPRAMRDTVLGTSWGSWPRSYKVLLASASVRRRPRRLHLSTAAHASCPAAVVHLSAAPYHYRHPPAAIHSPVHHP